MRIQSIIIPMRVSISAITVGGSNTQIYDTELQEFIPDYRITPIVIALKAQKEEDGTVSEVTSFIDTLVYELVGMEWVQRNSTSTFVINSSAGTITIKENLPINSSRRFKIDTKIADSRRSGIYSLQSVESNLDCKIMSDSPFRLIHEYLDGQGSYVIRPLDNYRLREKMMKGTTEWIQTYYRWYRRINNVDTEITAGNANGITGLNTNTLSVPYVEIPDREVSYKCVADPAVDLTGVNLISKKMISDDWNAIIPLISTPGQDADGKYCAINQRLLYLAHNSGTKDVFGGKIKYKPGQRYCFSVKWKLQEVQPPSDAGLIFYIVYTDDSNNRIACGHNQTSVITYSVATGDGRTIKNIIVTYGANAYKTMIYDIQLVEYHGAVNLVSGGNQFRIPVAGVATSASLSKTLKLSESLRQYLTAGTKLTISYENVNFIANNNFTGTLSYTDNTGAAKVIGFSLANVKQNTIMISSAGNTGTGAINMIIATNAGGAIDVNGLMVVVGDIPYKYSPADGEFLPAIPDGAPKPPLSDNAKTDIMVLSRKYPANYTKREVQTYNSNLPGNVPNVFGGRVDLDTATGTIQRPELSYSCLWYKKPIGGAESLLARGFNIMEEYSGAIDIRTEVKQGLDDAKCAAKFNGVDQYLYASATFETNPPLFNNQVIDFILNEYSDRIKVIFDVMYHSNGLTQRITIWINETNNIVVGTVNGSVVSECIVNPAINIGKNRLYRVELRSTSGILRKILVNGIEYSFNIRIASVIAIPSTSSLYINGVTQQSNITVLMFKYYNANSNIFALFDFQPINGDRSKMLTSKIASSPITLTPYNIDNIDDPNPATGFFTTI